MKTSIIPTLRMDKTILKTIEDKTLHVLTSFIFNPGNTSSFYENELGSLRKLLAQYGSNRQVFASNVEATLKEILSRHFENGNVNVAVDYKAMDDVYYSITINCFVNIPNSEPVISSQSIKIGSDGSFEVIFL